MAIMLLTACLAAPSANGAAPFWTGAGVDLVLPACCVSPGESFSATAHIYNNQGADLDACLVAALGIGSEYWLYPSWTHYPPDIDHGPLQRFGETPAAIPVIPEFAWPDTGSDAFSPISLLAALLNPELTELIGQMDSEEFGYSPYCAGRKSYGPEAFFRGWQVLLGDGVNKCEGEAPVSLADIRTADYEESPEGGYSELQANVNRRRVQAHNITVLPIPDAAAFNYVHRCGFQFKLPYLPVPDPAAEFNGQTVEGGLFVWDGLGVQQPQHLDYGSAFQWIVNPWDQTGDLRTYTADGWKAAGHIDIDTEWHQVDLIINYPRRTTTLLMDGQWIPCEFVALEKTGFGEDVTARLQAEIISISPDPCDTGARAMHKVWFKNYYWTWELPAAS